MQRYSVKHLRIGAGLAGIDGGWRRACRAASFASRAALTAAAFCALASCAAYAASSYGLQRPTLQSSSTAKPRRENPRQPNQPERESGAQKTKKGR
jgi:hypothetical protein